MPAATGGQTNPASRSTSSGSKSSDEGFSGSRKKVNATGATSSPSLTFKPPPMTASAMDADLSQSPPTTVGFKPRAGAGSGATNPASSASSGALASAGTAAAATRASTTAAAATTTRRKPRDVEESTSDFMPTSRSRQLQSSSKDDMLGAVDEVRAAAVLGWAALWAEGTWSVGWAGLGWAWAV